MFKIVSSLKSNGYGKNEVHPNSSFFLPKRRGLTRVYALIRGDGELKTKLADRGQQKKKAPLKDAFCIADTLLM